MPVSLYRPYHGGADAELAIIHYAPPAQGSTLIARNEMYLCDSGAQYLDGQLVATHVGLLADYT